MNTRRKRSLDTADSSPANRLRRRSEETVTDGLSERVHQTQTPKEITRSLLQRCFQTLNEGIRWRILLLEDGYDDISVGMGIDWEDLLPLLINHGLLYSTKRSIDCDYCISRDSWQPSIYRDIRMQVTVGILRKQIYCRWQTQNVSSILHLQW